MLEILPFIKCANEATTLISITVICMKLDAAVAGLLALIEHRLVADDRHEKASSCDNGDVVSPFLHTYVSSLDSRARAVESSIRDMLHKLESHRSSVQQYGEQNNSIAMELAENDITELAEQKKNIGEKELKICRQIRTVIIQSTTLSKCTEHTFSTQPDALVPSHYSKCVLQGPMAHKKNEGEENNNVSSSSMPSPTLIAPEDMQYVQRKID